MTIAVGADHAGYASKELLKGWLREMGHEPLDLGTAGTDPVDYPDFAVAVARAVAGGRAALGIVVCGSGIGVSIAANKVRGIRAAYCTDTYSARHARGHNDANMLTLGERVTGPGLMRELVEAFLSSSFEGGRHARRVDKIIALDEVR